METDVDVFACPVVVADATCVGAQESLIDDGLKVVGNGNEISDYGNVEKHIPLEDKCTRR